MKLMVIVLLMLIGLNVADVWTTTQILQKGGTELNPIFKEINEVTIILKMGFTFFGSALIVKTYNQAMKENSKLAKGIIWAVLIGVLVFYIYVVVHNSLVLFTGDRI